MQYNITYINKLTKNQINFITHLKSNLNYYYKNKTLFNNNHIDILYEILLNYYTDYNIDKIKNINNFINHYKVNNNYYLDFNKTYFNILNLYKILNNNDLDLVFKYNSINNLILNKNNFIYKI